MFVLFMERKRKTKTISIDPIVWDAIDKEAKRQGISASRWLENFAFDNLQKFGLIDKDTERLGEIRGGDRSNKEDN
ncbi:hypothetical protein [Nostoc sp. NMS4]|uniref:hypothetical protein n=1 Tax=Nostoc sp. NMS4 TaxID=2815390 RepID=UPI0025CFFF3A|nr:hypothetical protein [Nostoc sp. NMS4]MBN3923331.1 hypothetical protein [Nostoc sp. NMS4]